MKKIKNLFTSIALLGVTAQILVAQRIDISKVGSEAKTTFAKSFPGATLPKWEIEKNDYEVNFKSNGKTMSAVITKTGDLKETEMSIPVSGLLPQIIAYVKAHYKNAGIKEAAKIIKKGGIINYEAEVNKKDILFDEKGNFISVNID